MFRFTEDRAEIFLCFPDVFADHAGKIDLEQIKRELMSKDFRRHGFTGSRGTGEQHIETFASRQFMAEPPIFVHLAPEPHPGGNTVKLPEFVGRKDNVIPRVPRLDLYYKTTDLRRG